MFHYIAHLLLNIVHYNHACQIHRHCTGKCTYLLHRALHHHSTHHYMSHWMSCMIAFHCRSRCQHCSHHLLKSLKNIYGYEKLTGEIILILTTLVKSWLALLDGGTWTKLRGFFSFATFKTNPWSWNIMKAASKSLHITVELIACNNITHHLSFPNS